MLFVVNGPLTAKLWPSKVPRRAGKIRVCIGNPRKSEIWVYPDPEWNLTTFFWCYNFVCSYSPRTDTLRTFCMKLVDFNYFPMPQIQDFIFFEVFPTFFDDFSSIGSIIGELRLRSRSLTEALPDSPQTYRVMKNHRKSWKNFKKT